MGYEWAHSGSVRLKAGATLQDVLNLFACEGEEPHLPMTGSGEAELEAGHVWIRVDHDVLEYRADGDRAFLDDQMTAFLSEVAAELAAEGWIDYELEDHPVPYGPSELARAEARLQEARTAVAMARSEVAAAEAELDRLRLI